MLTANLCRLATERLSEAERRAALDEKAARKLRIKERKDRKRRLARAGGGRQSGDMRLMTVDNWKNDGDIWRGKVSQNDFLFRPALMGLETVLAIDSESTPYPANIHSTYAPIAHEACVESFRQR